MGLESLDTVYIGHNLLTIDSGFVAEQTYMTKGSFFQDDIVYEMSRDGVFENGRAWNQKTGKPVPIKDCYDGYMKGDRYFEVLSKGETDLLVYRKRILTQSFYPTLKLHKIF